MSTRCRIEMLGGLRVLQGGRTITRFRSQKFGVLLAYLALHKDRVHPREFLITLLWPDADRTDGQNNLRVALSALRRQLEPPGIPSGAILQTDRFAVGLNSDVVATDVAEFEAATRKPHQIESLEEAVRLYHGDFLPGYYENWIIDEQRRLAEVFFEAAHGLIQGLEQAGNITAALEHAQRAVQVEPLREEFHRDLMRLLASSGDRDGTDAALRQFHEWERRVEEDGREATPSLRQFARDLERRAQALADSTPAATSAPRPSTASEEGDSLLKVSRNGDGAPPEEPSPIKAEVEHAGQLPLQVTRFFGRDLEIARLAEMLRSTSPVADGDEGVRARIVTLTGPGGTGKTRLAVRVAERLRESYRGAIWFVPLADLANARLIPGAIVDALRIPRSPDVGRMEQAAEVLMRQPCILVLDNYEHLVRQGAVLVRTLLERFPTLTCLITSRQPLHLTGEHEFPVPPLPTPQRGEDDLERMSRVPSVQLLVDRAQSVRPDFQLTGQNGPAVAELCTRLDGIPLALELAAARIQVLTVRQMVIQLDRRFDLLVSRKRDISQRHRTLRAAMDWSYGLLTPELQRFFRRLSVFRGGWTLEAAEAVCAGDDAFAWGKDGAENVLDAVSHLRDCSLVLAEESGSEMCFRMIESLREYGEERLREAGEEDTVRDAHRDFFLRLAEAAEAHLRGSEQAKWLGVLDAQYDNLQTALERSLLQVPPDAGLRLASALWQFWLLRGRLSEGRELLGSVLAHTSAFDRSPARAKALNAAGMLAYCQGDYSRARVFHEEGLTIWREVGHRQYLSYALLGLGFVATAQDDYELASSLYEECLPILRECGDTWGLTWALNNMGNVAWHRGDCVLATALYQESLELKRKLGDRQGIAEALANLALAASLQGEYAGARALHQESLSIRWELGDRRGVAASLEGLAGLAAARATEWPSDETTAAAKRAARLSGAAQALRMLLGTRLSPTDHAEHQRAIAPARAALSQQTYEAERAAGAELSIEEAIASALADDAV